MTVGALIGADEGIVASLTIVVASGLFSVPETTAIDEAFDPDVVFALKRELTEGLKLIEPPAELATTSNNEDKVIVGLAAEFFTDIRSSRVEACVTLVASD